MYIKKITLFTFLILSIAGTAYSATVFTPNQTLDPFSIDNTCTPTTCIIDSSTSLGTTTINLLNATTTTSVNSTATFSTTTNSTSTNLFSTNASISNATTTNFFSNLINALVAVIENLTTTNSTSTGIFSLSGMLKDTTGATGTPGQILSSTGTSTFWIDPNSSTNSTTTNSFATTSVSVYSSTTNSTSTNLFSTNASVTNSTSTNLFSQLSNFFTSIISNLIATNATTTNSTTTGTLVSTGTTTLSTTTSIGSFTGLIYGVNGALSAASTSAGLSAIITDETGSGNLVFSNSPTVNVLTVTGTSTFNGAVGITGTTTIQNVLDMSSNRIGNLASPVNSNDAANKAYVDLLASSGVSYVSPVINFATTSVASTTGDRYIIATTTNIGMSPCTIDTVCQNVGSIWATTTRATGTTLFVTNLGVSYSYTGSAWVAITGVSSHNTLSGLQGGDSLLNNYYHLNLADWQALTSVNAQLTNLQITGSPTFNNSTTSNSSTTNLYVGGILTLASGVNTSNATFSNATLTSQFTNTGTTTLSTTTITNLYVTNSSSTNSSSTNSTSTNFFSTNASITNATTTNLFASLLNVITAFIATLTTNSIQSGTITATNTMYANNFYATTSNSSSSNILTLNFVNATGSTLGVGGLVVASSSNLNGTTTFGGAIDAGSNKIVNLSAPSNNTDAANKAYVDALIQGLSWQNPAINFITTATTSSSTGDRYIVATTNNIGMSPCDIYDVCQNVGVGQWSAYSVATGTATGTAIYVQQLGNSYTWNGGVWAALGASFQHNSLLSIQGGNGSTEAYHLTLQQWADLTTAGAQLAQLKATGTPTFGGITTTGTSTIASTTIASGTINYANIQNFSLGTGTISSSTNLFANIQNLWTNILSVLNLNATNATITNATSSNFAVGNLVATTSVLVSGTTTLATTSATQLSLSNALILASSTAISTTTLALYNNNGTLYWNGSALVSGGTATGTAGTIQLSDGNGGFTSTSTFSYSTSTNVLSIGPSSGQIRLFATTTGIGNTSSLFLGKNAGNFTTNGSANMGFGDGALTGVTSGSWNTAFGVNALSTLNSASYNTAFGNYSLGNNNLGAQNTAIGFGSGLNTTGSNNIFLGLNASASTSAASNMLSIGNVLFGSGMESNLAYQTNRISTNGMIAVGSTTPFAKFGIHANSSDTLMNLFAVGSSTASATSTLFLITNNGGVGIGTTTNIYGGNLTQGLTINNALVLASSTAISTTTFALYNNNGTLYWNGSAVGGSSSLPASTTSLFVNTNGQIGVGTSTFSTTTTALTVVGNMTNLIGSGGLIKTAAKSVTFGLQGGIAINEDYAYVLDQGNGLLRIYDISNMENPTQISSLAVAANPYSIAFNGSYIYLGGTASAVLNVVNVSNPSVPTLIASTTIAGGSAINNIAINGKYLYAGNALGISVFDISNPYILQSINTFGSNATSDLKVSGKYLYATINGTPSILIYDLTNPTSPTFVTSDATMSQLGDIYIQGKFLYTNAVAANKFAIYNISNPGVISFVASTTVSTPVPLVVSGKYAYVGGAGVLSVIDIASSTNPRVVATTTVPSIRSMELIGKYLVIPGSTFHIIDTTGAEFGNLTAATIHVGDMRSDGDIYTSNNLFVGNSLNTGLGGILTSGALVALATSSTSYFGGGITLATTSSATTTNSLYNTAGDLYWNGSLVATSGMVTAASLPASSTSLYVNSLGQVGIGTSTFSTSTVALNLVGNMTQLQASTTLLQVGSTTIAAASTGSTIKVKGRYAFSGMQNGIFNITDISDPTNPKFVASTTVGAYVGDIYITGNYAYVNSGGTFYTVDISNINIPTITGSVGITGAQKMELVGRYAYVVESTTNTVKVVDVSSSTAPAVVNSIAAGSSPYTVKARGKFLYVLNLGGTTMNIYDLSNPRTPSLISSPTILASSGALAINDKYAYIGSSAAIKIMDISSSTNAFSVGNISALGRPYSMVISGRYLYSGNDTSNTIQVFDVSSSTSPTLLGTTASAGGGNTNLIDIYGKYLVVLSSNTIKIYDTTGLEVNAAIVHSLESSNIVSRSDITASNNVYAGNSLFVGNGGIFSNGNLTILATSTASYFGGGIALASSTPPVTTNTLYNQGGLLYFNGSLVASQGLPASTTSLYVGTNGGTAIGTTTNIYGGALTAGLTLKNSLILASISNPATTTYALYNNSGTLFWNGNSLVTNTLNSNNTPTYSSGVDTGGSATGVNNNTLNKVAVSGRYAFVVGTGSTTACSSVVGSGAGCEIQVYDVSNPSSPLYIAGVDTTGSTNSGAGTNDINDVFVSGKYLVTISSGNATACSNVAGSAIGCELKVFDISNPAIPQYVGGMDVSGSKTGTGNANALAMKVVGKYIYATFAKNATACSQVAGSAIGCEFKIFDMSNPTNITYVSGFDNDASQTGTSNSSDLVGIDVEGRYAYVINTQIISGNACSNTAGTGADACELKVFDISNPASPTYAGGMDGGGVQNGTDLSARFTDIKVQGGYAYISGWGAGACSSSPGGAASCKLRVFNVTKPATITYVYGSSSGNTTTSLFISGRMLYTVSDGDTNTCTPTSGGFSNGCEIKVWLLSDPENPSYVGGIDISGSTTGVINTNTKSISVNGKYVYVVNAGDSTACSQVAGSANGCEFQIYDSLGTEMTGLTVSNLEAGSLSISNDLIARGVLSGGSLIAGIGGIYSGGAMTVMATNTPYALRISGNVCLDLNSDGACTDTTSAISDENLKQNTATITDALATLNKLNGVTFDWKEDNIFGALVGNTHSLGFIAQQVQKVLPEFDLVSTTSAGYLVLDYGKIVAIVVNAIQELQDKFFANEVHAKNIICVGEVCVDERQLKKLLENAGETSAPSTSSGQATSTASTTSPQLDTDQSSSTETTESQTNTAEIIETEVETNTEEVREEVEVPKVPASVE